MLSTADTPPAEPAQEFDAFISYRADTSRKAARRLQRALVALSKRHRPDADSISLFLDTHSLTAGQLDAGIQGALRESRSLVVLLANGTRDSPWVDREIEYWLGNGGNRERLYLIRHDTVDLRWDSDAGGFVEPGALPSALTDVFDSEQKWFELRSALTGTDETSLVGLYASIMGIAPAELLLAEADFQRRRKRLTRVVISSLSVLLVMALVAASLALVNWRNSETNRVRADREALQALGDASAAQALLAAEDSAARGIELAVEAARHSSSTSVRAALLAVANTSAVLQRAFQFPRQEAGYPGTGVAFSSDDSHLLAWGSATDRHESYLVQWNLESGRREFAERLGVAKLDSVASVSPTWAAGCSEAGPVIVDADTHETRRLDPAGRLGLSCATSTFGGGIVISTRDTESPGGKSYFLNRAGRVSELDGMPSVATQNEAVTAVVAGTGGIAVLRADGVSHLTDRPVRTVDVLDDNGAFAVRADDKRWVLGHPEATGYRLVELTASPNAVDSAPMLPRTSGFTDQLAEISADGTVSMQGVEGSVRLSTGAGHLRDFATNIESVQGGFVAVFRDSASVIWPPGQTAYPAAVSKQPRDSWRVLASGWSLNAEQSGQEAVVGSCEDHQQLYLTGASESSTIWSIDTDRLAQRFDNVPVIGRQCGIVSAASGIIYHPKIDPQGARPTLRGSSTFDDVALSGDEDRIAVIRADQPIEILATSGAVNKPWGVRKLTVPEVSTALGERRMIMNYDRVTTVSPDGGLQAWQDSKRGDVYAVHPSGTELLVDVVGPGAHAVLVTDAGTGPEVDPQCANDNAKYVPSAGFEVTSGAAQKPVLVADSARGVIDCRTGQSIDAIAPDRVVDYGITPTGGRIVWRDDGGRIQISDWRAGQPSVRTRQAPESLARPDAQAFVTASEIAGVADGEGLLRIYRAADGGWREQSTIPISISKIAGVALADGGTLAVVMAADASFEIFDVTTGRRVVSSRDTVDDVFRPHRISIYESDGYITVMAYKKGKESADVAIEIPVTVELLVEQLCTTFAAASCPGSGG